MISASTVLLYQLKVVEVCVLVCALVGVLDLEEGEHDFS